MPNIETNPLLDEQTMNDKPGNRGVSCILNPAAAKKKWLKKKKLRDYIRKHLPGQIYDVASTKENTIKLARKLSLDHRILIAAGGDGTVADVIQGIIEAQREKDVLFGIIPLGCGNAFRKSLAIPKNTKKAVKVIMEGETREIDLIDVEGKAAGFVSIGATAKVTQKKLQHSKEGLIGHLLAAKILFTQSQEPQEIELIDGITDDGESFDKKLLRLKLLDCVVGKTNYFGYSWKIAPKAKLDDGLLDITLFETGGLKYILSFPLIYFGLFQKKLKHFKARKMIIRGNKLPVQYNGEFLGLKDRIEVKVLPQAIKIICPQKSKA